MWLELEVVQACTAPRLAAANRAHPSDHAAAAMMGQTQSPAPVDRMYTVDIEGMRALQDSLCNLV